MDPLHPDPQELLETFEKIRRGDFHPDKIRESLENIRRMKEANQAANSKPVTDTSPQQMPILRGETFAKLLQAVEAYPSKYDVNISPKKKTDINIWLEQEIGCSSREAFVFGSILREHFSPDDVEKTSTK
jgi:hypothetical protein